MSVDYHSGDAACEGPNRNSTQPTERSINCELNARSTRASGCRIEELRSRPANSPMIKKQNWKQFLTEAHVAEYRTANPNATTADIIKQVAAHRSLLSLLQIAKRNRSRSKKPRLHQFQLQSLRETHTFEQTFPFACHDRLNDKTKFINQAKLYQL